MITKQKKIIFQPGNGLVFKWPGVISNIISRGKGDYWTHIGIIVQEDKEHVWIQEASVPKMKTNKYTKEFLLQKIQENICGVLTPNFKFNPNEIPIIATKYEDLPYDKAGIIQIGLYEIFSWFGKTPWFEVESTERVICSEHYSRFMYDLSHKTVRLDIEYNKKYDRIRPQECYMSVFFEIIKFIPEE